MHRITLGVSVALALACSGTPGPQGPEGPPGPQGPAGPAGTFTGNFGGAATFSGDLNVAGQIVLPAGEGPNTAATSCAALLAARPGIASGAYWLKPSTASDPFRAYCDMTNEGGGWTLVWSNLRGGRGKPFTELQWKNAINTLPRVAGTMGQDLESFIVYTGLKHWTALAPGNQLRTDWAPDFGAAIDQRYICAFSFTDLSTYQITFNLPTCRQPVGSVVPGLVGYSNNAKFSAYDVNNTGGAACAPSYTNAPWWYVSCWSGSMVGGGELSQGHANGAFWTGSGSAWGAPGGTGGGNGWIYVK
jgi:fibrinogen beta/gamma subunit family protein